MKVILLKDDKKLGKKDSIKEVKNGYGRYLVEKGVALYATKKNLDNLEREKRDLEEIDKTCRKIANKIKEDIENEVFYIDKKYNKETLRLNGSVTKRDVLNSINKVNGLYNFTDISFTEFPKAEFADTIYTGKLKIYSDIIININFKVRLV